jgi:hypothetical protein
MVIAILGATQAFYSPDLLFWPKGKTLVSCLASCTVNSVPVGNLHLKLRGRGLLPESISLVQNQGTMVPSGRRTRSASTAHLGHQIILMDRNHRISAGTKGNGSKGNASRESRVLPWYCIPIAFHPESRQQLAGVLSTVYRLLSIRNPGRNLQACGFRMESNWCNCLSLPPVRRCLLRLCSLLCLLCFSMSWLMLQVGRKLN